MQPADTPAQSADPAANAAQVGDLSALAWVHDELRRTLETALKSLRRALREQAARPAEAAAAAAPPPVSLGQARTQLHQAQGVLVMVGLPAAARTERLFGRSLPLVSNVPADARHGMILSGLEWVSGKLVPALLYQRFGAAPPPDEAARLWRLQDDLFARREAIARAVSQGLLSRPGRPAMLSGVYFAGTGPDAADRAFAAGVLAELRLSQNLVAWTPAATADERDCRRTAVVGYTAILLATIALVAFGWWTWNQ